MAEVICKSDCEFSQNEDRICTLDRIELSQLEQISPHWFVIGDEILHTFTASTETWAATMNHYIYMDSVNSNEIYWTN